MSLVGQPAHLKTMSSDDKKAKANLRDLSSGSEAEAEEKEAVEETHSSSVKVEASKGDAFPSPVRNPFGSSSLTSSKSAAFKRPYSFFSGGSHFGASSSERKEEPKKQSFSFNAQPSTGEKTFSFGGPCPFSSSSSSSSSSTFARPQFKWAAAGRSASTFSSRPNGSSFSLSASSSNAAPRTEEKRETPFHPTSSYPSSYFPLGGLPSSPNSEITTTSMTGMDEGLASMESCLKDHPVNFLIPLDVSINKRTLACGAI